MGEIVAGNADYSARGIAGRQAAEPPRYEPPTHTPSVGGSFGLRVGHGANLAKDCQPGELLKTPSRVSLTLIRNRTKIPCIVNDGLHVGRPGMRAAGLRTHGCLEWNQRACLRLSGMRPLPICGGLREVAELRLPGRRRAPTWSGTSMPAHSLRACECMLACGAEQAQPDARRFVDVWKTARGGLCHGR